MSLSITVLGSSSALPTSKRFPTAQVLKIRERFFLIDCGEGTQIQIRRFKIPLSRIHHIFISHLHGDHVFGLFGLLSSMNLMGRKAALTIHAHATLEPTLEHFKKYFGTELLFQVKLSPIPAKRQALIYEDKQITVEAIPLKHRISCSGFLFREKKLPLNIKKEMVESLKIPYPEIIRIKNGADYVSDQGVIFRNKDLTLPEIKPLAYAYISDTSYKEKIADVLKDVDILYHEATFLDTDRKLARATGHSTALQAATIAKKADVHKLLIGHFSPRYKDVSAFVDEARAVFQNTFAVNDGDVFEAKEQRVLT